MMTPLEAARYNPRAYPLRHDEKFVSRMQRDYFSKAQCEADVLKEDLWNALEGAAKVALMVAKQGFPDPGVKEAQQICEKLEPILKELAEDAGKSPQAVSRGFLYLIQRTDTSEFTDEQKSMNSKILKLLCDGEDFKTLLYCLFHITETAKVIEAPNPFRKSNHNPLKAWSVCMGMFWAKVFLEIPTITKAPVRGGTIITSEFGKFAEECLNEIGIDARYSLRTPIEYARKHLKEDVEYQRLLSHKQYEAAAKHLAARKDRIPIAML